MKPGGKSQRGASLVEYGTVVGLVSVLSIGAVFSLGNEIRSLFGAATTELAGQAETPAGSGGGTSNPGNDPVGGTVPGFPDDADCQAIPLGGSVDPGFSCFLVNETVFGSPLDFTAVPGPLVVKSDPVGETYLSATPAGMTVVHTGPGDWNPLYFYGSSGTDEIHVQLANCASRFVSQIAGLYVVEFGGGLEVHIDNLVDGLYCSGSGVYLSIADIIDEAAGGNSGGGSLSAYVVGADGNIYPESSYDPVDSSIADAVWEEYDSLPPGFSWMRFDSMDDYCIYGEDGFAVPAWDSGDDWGAVCIADQDSDLYVAGDPFIDNSPEEPEG